MNDAIDSRDVYKNFYKTPRPRRRQATNRLFSILDRQAADPRD